MVQDLLSRPQDAAGLVGKKVIVEIKSTLNKSVCGYFHSMDPTCGHLSIVVLEGVGGGSEVPQLKSTHILMASHVKSILVVEAGENQAEFVNKLFVDTPVEDSNQEVQTGRIEILSDKLDVQDDLLSS